MTLIIEDDESNSFLLSIIVKRNGLKFKIASSKQEALEIIRTEHIDLIITDLLLSDGMATEIIDTIDLYNKNCYIIVVSGFYHYETALRGRRYNSFFMKPFSVLELEKTIKSYIH